MFRFSEWLALMMVENEIITLDEYDYYVYAICVNIEKIIGYIIILSVGIIFDQFIGMIFFLVSFSNIRKRSGGVHCNTSLGCFITTLLISVISIILVKFTYGFGKLWNILFIISVFIIIKIGAVNNPNINWSEEELYRARISSRKVIFLEIIIYFIIKYFEPNCECTSYIRLAVIISAFSLGVNFVERRNYDTKEESSS